MDVNKWPSYCQIREFKMDLTTSSGVRLNDKSSPKNELPTPNEIQTHQEETGMVIA